MATVMMVGQAIFKIVLGAAADKNAKGALWFAFVAGVGGVLLCWLGSASEYMMYVAPSSSAPSTPRPSCSCPSW